MALFGKKKNRDAREVAEIDDEMDALDTWDDGDDVTDEAPLRRPYDRASLGPWDETERESDDLLDLGALRVSGFDGMELRLELNQQTGDVIGITVVAGESQMQVHPYAAPRTAGVWNDIRMEIADNVRGGGGIAEVDEGALGTHLDVQLQQALPGGGTGMVPMRFYGVDGPRWFVRGLLMGPALTDDVAREQLEDWFRSMVVVRGQQPMAPRTPLTLHLPADAQMMPQGGLVPPIASAEDPEGVEDLNPFERGPEITEIR